MIDIINKRFNSRVGESNFRSFVFIGRLDLQNHVSGFLASDSGQSAASRLSELENEHEKSCESTTPGAVLDWLGMAVAFPLTTMISQNERNETTARRRLQA